MNMITETAFHDLTFTCKGEQDGYGYIFRCNEYPAFDLVAVEGDDNEHGWVRLINDVGVIAGDSSIRQRFTLDGDSTLLNIDAAPELVRERLEFPA